MRRRATTSDRHGCLCHGRLRHDAAPWHRRDQYPRRSPFSRALKSALGSWSWSFNASRATYGGDALSSTWCRSRGSAGSSLPDHTSGHVPSASSAMALPVCCARRDLRRKPSRQRYWFDCAVHFLSPACSSRRRDSGRGLLDRRRSPSSCVCRHGISLVQPSGGFSWLVTGCPRVCSRGNRLSGALDGLLQQTFPGTAAIRRLAAELIGRLEATLGPLSPTAILPDQTRPIAIGTSVHRGSQRPAPGARP